MCLHTEQKMKPFDTRKTKSIFHEMFVHSKRESYASYGAIDATYKHCKISIIRLNGTQCHGHVICVNECREG
ncbi:CLUMA_CG015979, isoform A [Clunio marinus]|uniref:CLUMA_CG015979, isoform A n=1 Tax=Clunio marinus TaxID=568069 RepID=A0A1J1ITA8_9DIPT|nr:CLUMA_CG015979, isoform A [Clunio marinus]